MSDENSSSTEAAETAVADFWANNPEAEEAAAREVPDAPRNPRGNVAVAAELADQQAELEQSGEVDPEAADGIPVPEKVVPVTQAKQTPGKSAPVVAEVAETGLDPVLRSIAEDAGWTADKIDRLYKADPELATETFEQLADSYANLSRQLVGAAPGTTPAAQFNQQQPAQTQNASNNLKDSASQLNTLLSDEALTKFAAENGEQSANLIKAIRDTVVAQNVALEQRVAKFEQASKQAEDRAIAQEASKVVTTLREKFPTIYGKGTDRNSWTVGQFNKNVELAEMADQIRAGGLAQGRNISVEDAIKRAHYIVSRDSVKSEARTELAATIKKRAKTVTAKPSQRTDPNASGQSRSDAAAVNAAAEKMAEIGFNDE